MSGLETIELQKAFSSGIGFWTGFEEGVYYDECKGVCY